MKKEKYQSRDAIPDVDFRFWNAGNRTKDDMREREFCEVCNRWHYTDTAIGQKHILGW